MTNLPAYSDLDINQRIQLKGLLRDWARITAERLQRSLWNNVYASPVKRPRRRTNRLLTDWRINESGGTDNPGVMISSLYYGRFIELGTRKGAKAGSMKAQRRAKRWYSPVKNREITIIRSLLIKKYSLAIVQIASQQIEDQIAVSI